MGKRVWALHRLPLWEERAWPLILAMFLVLGLSPTYLLRASSGTYKAQSVFMTKSGPEDPSGLCALEPLPMVLLPRPGWAPGSCSCSPCTNAHVTVLSRYTAVGTGATATPLLGNAGSSISCLASPWLLWPLPYTPL